MTSTTTVVDPRSPTTMTTNNRSIAEPDRNTLPSASESFVVGGGSLGASVAEQLAAGGGPVTFVDRTPPRDRSAPDTTVRVDRFDAQSLDAAGIGDASVVFVLEPKDATNLLLAQLARSRFGVERVVALVNDPERASAFDGVDVEIVDATALVAGALTDQL